MHAGDRKQLTVPPEQGYGHRDPNLERAVSRESVPEGVAVGDKLIASVGSAEIPVWVRQLTETHAVIDANHPLAGQTLNLEIEIVSQATDANRPSN
jgi:FKBP-type peptidyl-prolyl cis-trans isomerase 2